MPYHFPKPKPYSFFDITTTPSRSALWTLFGTMCAERVYNAREGLLPVYGDNTPADAIACVDNVENGVWKPIVWTFHDLPGGIHWLHDFHDTTSWIGGYVMPGFRGQENTYLRLGLRDLFKSTVNRMGYQTVHAGVCCRNTPAIRWAETVLGSHRAGVCEKWLPVGGELTDFVIYTWREEDCEQAMMDAEARRHH